MNKLVLLCLSCCLIWLAYSSAAAVVQVIWLALALLQLLALSQLLFHLSCLALSQLYTKQNRYVFFCWEDVHKLVWKKITISGAWKFTSCPSNESPPAKVPPLNIFLKTHGKIYGILKTCKRRSYSTTLLLSQNGLRSDSRASNSLGEHVPRPS